MNLLRLLSVALFAAISTVAGYDNTACNNSPALCSVPYNRVLHLGAHNSAFVRTVANNFNVAGNQYFNATTQLSAGVRLLQSQMHIDGGIVKLCHTTCFLFDGGALLTWLSDIAGWMRSNPSEVVTVLLVNDDKIAPATLKALFEQAGLGDLGFVPTAPGVWPTLGEMVKNGTRLVTFLSTGADIKVAPRLLPEFDYLFETPFETFSPSTFSCQADRPSGVAGAEATTALMPLMNRFFYDVMSQQLKMYKSNSTYSATLNSDAGIGNLADGVATCLKSWGGRQGGFVLLDSVNEGNAVAIVDRFNNVTKPYNRIDFPENPKETAEKAQADAEMGWARIQKLSGEAHSGSEVKAGSWVWFAGNWVGSFGTM